MFVLLSNGEYYGLLGLSSTPSGSNIQNDTAQISVTGWVWTGYSSSPGYVQGQAFQNDIYVQTYTIAGQTYTIAEPTPNVPGQIITVTGTLF
jgi:hypothetical protein